MLAGGGDGGGGGSGADMTRVQLATGTMARVEEARVEEVEVTMVAKEEVEAEAPFQCFESIPASSSGRGLRCNCGIVSGVTAQGCTETLQAGAISDLDESQQSSMCVLHELAQRGGAAQ